MTLNTHLLPHQLSDACASPLIISPWIHFVNFRFQAAKDNNDKLLLTVHRSLTSLSLALN